MNLNGGYAMIKHDATQNDLAVAYKTKRPVLLYDEDKRAHWAQINEKVIETVDEETQETIITYEYSYQLLNAIEALVDASGNPRFIEGDLEVSEITGVTFTYRKWSLSGTHLMIVLAGKILNGTTISAVRFADVFLPSYIMEKIDVIYSNIVEIKEATLYALDQNNQVMSITLSKENNVLRLYRGGSTTVNYDRNFRIQFDLLIDAE